MSTAQIISIVLNAIGMCIEIIAIIMLFSNVTGLKPLDRIDYWRTWNRSNPDTVIPKLIDAINERINRMNEINSESHKKNRKWLAYAIVGMLLQLSAIFISVYSPNSPVSDKQDSANNQKQYYYRQN
jgi:hypothetical protein